MNEFNAKKLAKKEIVDFMKITEKHRETFNHVSALFHTIVGGTNDIAHTYMRDAIEKKNQRSRLISTKNKESVQRCYVPI